MITITRRFTFEAAHRLPRYEGKCKDEHGHRYELEVTVKGHVIKVGEKTGMVMDFSDLKEIVEKNVIDKLDHTYINDRLGLTEEILSVAPTAENMVQWIAKVLDKRLSEKNVELYRVRLWETENSYAEYISQL